MLEELQTARDPSPQPAERVNNYWHFRRNTDTAVIFIHGIFSSSKTCWLAENKVYWPDLVRSDPRLGQPAIYLAGFHTAFDAGALDVRSCAREIMDALARTDSDGTPPVLNYPRLVFVCHSTGGIVARYLIECYRDRFYSKAIGLALIASPTLGSTWADIGSLLARYHGNELALQLRTRDKSVDDINGRFKDLVFERKKRMPGLFGMEACETEFVLRRLMPNFLRFLVPNRWRVVGRSSAGQFFGEVKDLAGTNHFTAVKPTDFDHPAHQFLVTFFERFREDVATPPRGYDDRQRAAANTAAADATHLAVATAEMPAAPRAPFALSPELANIAQSSAALAEADQRPQLKELFEIITDPDDVRNALYMTDPGKGIAPYDCPYINSRQDVADVQEALGIALRQAKGRLLIYGASGIGKTREVVELARNACAAKWTVLVARPESNVRLGLPRGLPAQLADARLLVIVDNIHTKVSATADQAGAPYLERLHALLEWLERQVPGRVHALLIASDEPRFKRYIDVGDEPALWRGFRVFRLPAFTSEGLRQLLAGLADLARVPVAADEVGKLIENSDRKPATVFINVDLARRLGQPLGLQTWRPAEGESWKLRFASARAEHPGVGEICRALQLLGQAGLPARLPYVVTIADRMGGSDPAAATAALVGEGLLGQRGGIVAPFSAEQLQEAVGDAPPAAMLAEFREAIESEIVRPETRGPAWAEDLQGLALALVRIPNMEAAEQVGMHAARLAPDDGWPYKLQAGLRFKQLDLPGTLACLSKVLNLAPNDTDALFLRGAVHNLQTEFSAALDDFRRAIELGRDDVAVHTQVGVSYYHLHRWKEADAAFTAALQSGDTSAELLFTRAMARIGMNDLVAAEEDLSSSIEQRFDFAVMSKEFAVLAPGARKDDAPGPPPKSSALLLAIRAYVRTRLGNHIGAEEDLNKAIAAGPDESYGAMVEAAGNSPVPMIRQASTQMKAGAFGNGVLHFLRGMSRMVLGKSREAEKDFEEALAAGVDEGELREDRGWAYFRLEQHESAERDALAALEYGRKNVRSYALAGLARLALSKFPEAEAHFDAALVLAPQDAKLLLWRGIARMNQQKLMESETDFAAAFELDPSPLAAYLSGCTRFDLRKFPEAEADFTASTRLGHSPIPLYLLRAGARIAQGKVVEAAEDVEVAFAGGAGDVLAYTVRGLLRLQQGRFVEADADFTEAVKLGRSDAWIFAQRAFARQQLERFEDAEKDYDSAIKLGSADAEILMHRGTVRAKQRKAESAADDFSAAIAAGRDDAYAHFCLARENANLMRFREAEAAYEKALSRDQNPQFRAARSAMRVISGAFVQAEEDANTVIAQLPAEPDCRMIRAVARLGIGKLKAALEDIEVCISMRPDNADFIGFRALVRIRLGDLRNAENDCRLLEPLSPQKEAPGCRGTLELTRGDFASALASFETAALQGNEWRFSVGLANLLLGRIDKARRIYAQALTQTPSPADVLLNAANLDFQLRRHAKRLTPAIREAAKLLKAELQKPAEQARTRAAI